MRIEFIGFTDRARGVVPGLSEHSQYHLQQGRQYEVFALSVFNNIASVCVVSDLNFPLWVPSPLVVVVDGMVPTDWKITLGGGEISLVLGPPSFMGGVEEYVAFVELQPIPVQNFWNYFEERVSGSEG